jgi:uncharacterized YccA/Bax inhibitor family protein
MYIYEWNTYEKWAWYDTNFSRTLAHEYQGSIILMLFVEIIARFIGACSLLTSFALISIINGMLIRVAIKCSVLCIFPMLYTYECVMRRSISPGNIA